MKIFDEPFLVKPKKGSGQKKSGQRSLFRTIKSLLNQELYGVLCTQGGGQPYGSLVAFAASPDLKYLFFSTPVYTRKYKLLKESPRVSFVVDSRTRHPDDMARVEAITATGKTRLIPFGPKRKKTARLLGARHPQLKEFFAAKTCMIIQIQVTRYFHVTHFQEVNQWVVKKTG